MIHTQETKFGRRQFLKGLGVTLSLPFLESLSIGAVPKGAGAAKRAVFICYDLGFYAPNFFPQGTGAAYKPSPYLSKLEGLREQYTVFSGLSHPGVDGGHQAYKSFLTAVPHPRSPSYQNSISADQVLAEKIGHQTRYSYLSMTEGGLGGLSWNRNGVQIPADRSPQRVFDKLFVEGKASEKEAIQAKLDTGGSILDAVLEQASGLQRRIGRQDQDKLDQYFSSIRETEQRLKKSKQWLKTPKPEIDYAFDADAEQTATLYELITLALQTDSTRIIAFNAGVPEVQGVALDKHHDYSHHGKDAEKIAKLVKIEDANMRQFTSFLQKLRDTPDGSGRLLDNTAVMMGSNLGNASSHDTKNLPVILAGGRFRHGQHLAFDAQDNHPLCNVYVSMFQHMGLETDRFASSTGTITGI